MLRSSPASSMQKTYDDCYLICSTAVYFEKQNNEQEALRSWRSALDNIYYFNAYKMSPNYRPKNETERALQDSLITMERQCKERVDLLEALKKSREEVREDDNGSATPSKTLRSSSIPANTSAAANGTRLDIPSPYTRLARPQQAPAIPRARPSPSPIAPVLGRDNDLPIHSASYPSHTQPTLLPKASRTPSPDKKSGMLRSTLRSGPRDTSRGNAAKLNRSMRPSKPSAAGKAATLAWPGPPPTGSSGSLTSSVAVPTAAPPPYHDSPPVPPHAPPPVQSSPMTRASRPARPSRSSRSYHPDPFAGFSSANDSSASTSPSRSSHQVRRNDAPLSASGVGGGAKVILLGPPTPPPRPPLDTPADRRRSEGSTGVLTQALEPVADFPVYRKEFPQPKPIDVKSAQSLAHQMNANHINGSAHSQTYASAAGSSRKVPPPVPRKAIGTVAASKHPESSRRSSSGVTQRAEGALMSQQIGDNTGLLAERATFSAEQETSDASGWDARVKHVMNSLPRGVDEQAAKAIFNEIVIKGDEVHWDDVAGLNIAKAALKEAVVYPFLRPDLFMGLREPARGMLLFGPPGTGKTMLARAVATESKSTFFAISASSLTSKFLGESEKLVRALFSIAKALAPSIIFVDEIDSLLSARGGSSEHEATRRIKTEFLIQWSDLAKAAAGREAIDKTEGDATRVLVLAATNLPWAIDEAARRRFVRRQYIPLPEPHVREAQLRRLMSAQKHRMSDNDFALLVELTDGFSGSDITALAKDAAMGPLRSLGENLLHMAPEDIRPIDVNDFETSLTNIRPSVSKQGLKEFEDWARDFGERGG